LSLDQRAYSFGFHQDLHATVFVEHGCHERLSELFAANIHEMKHRKCLLIFDEKVRSPWAVDVEEALGKGFGEFCARGVRGGDSEKSLDTAAQLFHALAGKGFGRDSLIVALGGGSVSDLAGFVAGVWMRGIEWAVLPTTVEGAVDACLGGKTAVNLPKGKNLVGVFHHPVLIVVDPEFFATLDARDIRAGLAESVKHALLCSEEWLAWHERHADRILALQPEVIVELVERNLRFKGQVVAADPYERKDIRTQLNLGHTFGHAIEHASGFQLRHGECVAIGLVAACRLSRELGFLDRPFILRVESLLAGFGLPTRLAIDLDPKQILDGMKSDKKRAGGRPRFVLLESPGRAVIRFDVPEKLVGEIVESLFR
jgi:3-dehydroquinate synthase